VSWCGEILYGGEEVRAIVLLVSARGTTFFTILHIYMTNAKEGGGHLGRHQQEELLHVLEEEEQYFISFCWCFSVLLSVLFLQWHFFAALSLSL
jgi:hypothetical protein